MVMGEVSLCRVEELPPTFARELRPALAKGNPAVLFGDRVRHESVVRPWLGRRTWWSAAACSWSVAPVATHRKAVIGALANRFHNVAKPS